MGETGCDIWGKGVGEFKKKVTADELYAVGDAVHLRIVPRGGAGRERERLEGGVKQDGETGKSAGG